MNVDPSTTAFLALRLRLRQYASRVLCSDAEAEDAVQELFLRTWRKTSGGSDKAFLFASLRNICIDSLRHRRFTARPEEAAEPAADGGHTLENRDIIDHIDRFVRQRLSGTVRQVFELHVREQLDYDEIATRLGISNEAVRTAMSRARKAVREYARQL